MYVTDIITELLPVTKVGMYVSIWWIYFYMYTTIDISVMTHMLFQVYHMHD